MSCRDIFKTDNGSVVHDDDVGLDLLDDATARLEAIKALPDMAREMEPDSDRRSFTSIVRDADGDTVYSVSMTIVGIGRPDVPRRA